MMKSPIVTNVLLFVIAVLLALLCIQNALPRKVVVYQDGSPVGAGLRADRSHALPVRIVN